MTATPVSIEPHAPNPKAAETPSRKGRTRRQVRHDWPEVGTILEGRYGGVEYEAEVIAAPRRRSGKALRTLSGPAAGKVCRSMSGAMLTATEAQRKQQRLGKPANGWAFWKVKKAA